MEKIDELKGEPVVGKYYLVPCGLIFSDKKYLGYAPLIGRKHNDNQFGVKDEHYHIDGRFSGTVTSLKTGNDGKTNAIVLSEMKQNNPRVHYVSEIEYKRKKCLRLTTGIEPPSRPFAILYWKWYDTMVGKSCKGKKCPHLGHDMREKDGKYICPLHGLIGDAKTEKIISKD